MTAHIAELDRIRDTTAWGEIRENNFDDKKYQGGSQLRTAV